MALTYIKETHATHGVIYEVTLCPACFAGLPDFMKTPHGRDAHGYRLEVRPWTGPADGECTQCDTLHSGGTGAGLAPEFRGLPVKALLLCALLLTPALAQAQPSGRAQDAIGAILLGNALDALSTEIALQRPGVREGNPFMGQSMPQRLIVKTLTTAATVYLTRTLAKRHPTVARVLGYSIGGALSAVAVHNFRMGER